MDKKDSSEAISVNPERKIFEFFTSMLMMVASQGDSKLSKLPACPKNSGYGTDVSPFHFIYY